MHLERITPLLLFTSIFGACAKHEETSPEPTVKHVRCEAVSEDQIADRVELRGTIAPLPDRDAQVAPQIAGRIVQVLVREGDLVRSGQALARIDASVYEDQVKEAEAALNKSSVDRKNAEATLARFERVFQHGIAARQEVDDARARAEGAKAQEAETEAAAQRARRQVERANVKSPLGGVVLRIFRRSGELVDGTPATPVVEVADANELELVSDASAADLVRTARGEHATVSSGALPGIVWTGTVSAVAPAVDRTTGLGTIRIAIDLSVGKKPPVGVLADAHIASSQHRKATLVPKEALRSVGGTTTEIVVCGADQIAHVIRVRRGIEVDARVEVEGVLARGDRVAVEPVLGINEGDKLEVVE